MSILARHGIFQPVRSQGVYCSDNVSSEKALLFATKERAIEFICFPKLGFDAAA